MTRAWLILAPVLLFAMASGKAKGESLTLRIKADDGRIEFYHRGKRLSDSGLEQLCATARRQKVEIDFQRDKMTRDDALAAILKEADCLGAAHSGVTRIDQERAPKSAPRKHAKPRHRAKARR